MRTLIRWTTWLVLASLLALTALVLHTVYARPLKIDWFFERVFIEYAVDDPELLSSMRMLPPWADWFSDDLTDRSLARQRELQQKLRDDLATLVRRIVPWLAKAEKLLKPRASVLVRPPVEYFVGLVCLVLAAIHDQPYDVQAVVKQLTALVDRLCLGPSTEAIANRNVKNTCPPPTSIATAAPMAARSAPRLMVFATNSSRTSVRVRSDSDAGEPAVMSRFLARPPPTASAADCLDQ